MKGLVLTLLSIMSFVFTDAKTNSYDSVTFYIKNKYLTEGDFEAKVLLSCNTYYPVYNFSKREIKLNRRDNGKEIKLKCSNRMIMIDQTSFYIDNGDTIYTEVVNSNSPVSFTNANNPQFFYIQYRGKTFLKNNQYPTSIISSDSTPFDYNTYKEYCYDYFNKERNFIDSFFNNKRFKVKSILLRESENSLLSALLYPALIGKVNDEKHRHELMLLVKQQLPRLNKFPKEEIDYTYQGTLSDGNLFLTGNVEANKIISAKNYARLQKNASKAFSKKVYNYLLVSYLSIISRIGNDTYKKIARKMYTDIQRSDLNTVSKKQIDKIYKNFLVLTINVQSFKDIKIKNAQGKILSLGDIVQNDAPCLLDFWATWCLPCIEELPYLDSARQHLPGINFISLSIDENEEKWLSFLKKHETLHKSSYLLIDYKQSKIIQDYQISAVPRFIIYDKKGNCLSGDFIRPSTPDFNAEINELINSRD